MSDDLTSGVDLRHSCSFTGNLLVYSLVWTSVIEVCGIFFDDAVEMAFVQDQDVIQAFASYTSNEVG